MFLSILSIPRPFLADVSVKDAIKKSFLESGLFSNAVTFDTLIDMMIALTASLLVGLYIYFIYKVTFRGVVYSRSFAVSVTGMTVMTCMVTLAISTNVVLSLGMVGALSIVRYRTAVKEPLDLMFLFWGITSGIATGAQMYLLTLLGLGFVTLMVFLLNAKTIDGKIYIVVVRYTGELAETIIHQTFAGHKYTVRSKTLRKDEVEMTIEVYVRRNNLYFIDRLRARENVSYVTIIQYNGEYIG